MGDFLRYALFDKYFKKMGCDSPYCAPGTGEDSAHYLLSWYYAWGGSSHRIPGLGLGVSVAAMPILATKTP